MNIILLIVVGAICMALGRGLASLPWIWAVLVLAVPVGVAYLINWVALQRGRVPSAYYFVKTTPMKLRLAKRKQKQEIMEWLVILVLALLVGWLFSWWMQLGNELAYLKELGGWI